MKNLRFLSTICLIILLPYFSISQSRNIDLLKEKHKKISWQKVESQSLSNDNFIKLHKEYFGLDSDRDLKIQSVIKSKNNWKHYKYKQFYKDIPILTGNYTLHRKGNKLIKTSGNLLPFIKLNTDPELSEDIAIENAKNYIVFKYKDKLFIDKDSIFSSPPKLVIADNKYPDFSGEYRLAYEVIISFNTGIPHKEQMIIDSKTGNIINAISLICYSSVKGIANTKYSGRQNITVDSISKNKFLLQDLSRGDGIFTVNSYDNKVFSDEDNVWDNTNEYQDEIATDIHFGAISFYDFMSDRYGWKGLDNKGFELRSYVHYDAGASYVNAFWNGENVHFGDGDCANYGPLTSLDIVGHEFAHGFTQFSSGLIYSGESGALNESMSDIFGKAIEYYYGVSGSFTWDNAGQIVKSQNAEPFRSMKDPNLYNDPKFYYGNFWDSNQEVHTNSGVFNYWFYLLVEGGQGENELGLSFDVKPIGMDKAIDIVFLMQTAYLIPNSSYLHAKESSLEATKDLFGENSEELKAVREAWKAVGVFDPFYFEKDLKVSFSDKVASLCGFSGQYELKADVSNDGYGIIPKGTVIPLEYHFEYYGNIISNFPVEKEDFVLNKDLNSGDKTQVTFQKKIDFSDINLSMIDVVIKSNFEDLNKSNDKAIIRNISKGEKKDISIGLGIDNQKNCLVKDLDIVIYFTNSGCEPIPKGTILKGKISQSVSTTFSYTLSSDLNPGQSISKKETLAIHVTSGEVYLKAYLDFDDDNLENNSVESNFKILKAISNNYYEDFSHFNFTSSVKSKYFNISYNWPMVHKLREINNDTMLAFYSLDRSSVSDNIKKGCLDISGFYKDNKSRYFIPLDLCVDMKNSFSPKLSFDLIQNTNLDKFLEIPDYLRTICRVSFPNDYTAPSKYLYNLENKKLNHCEIKIPDSYSGKVRLEMFTLYSDFDKNFEFLFDKSDYILLDDIKISGIELGYKDQVVVVYPNPGKGLINFKRVKISRNKLTVKIYNSLGAFIDKFELGNDFFTWNADNISTGMYFYIVSEKDKTIDRGKLIIHN